MAGVAQWTERWPANQRVTGLIPSQGTCLGFRPGPQKGVHKRQTHIDVSLPFSPSLPLCLKINKILEKKSKFIYAILTLKGKKKKVDRIYFKHSLLYMVFKLHL